MNARKCHFINFATSRYYHNQESCRKSAEIFFDTIKCYREYHISPRYFREHYGIFRMARGFGYWLWKPYFILKRLNEIEEGEILFYCDSGATIIKDPSCLLELSDKQPVVPFELAGIEHQWTKRDAFIAMNCDEDTYLNTNQRLASFIVFRKEAITIEFVSEWLKYCENYHLLTDEVSRSENESTFIEHRHDQSIFSLLSKKYQFQAFRDPSQHGETGESGAIGCYPTVINHHRSGGNRNLSIRIIRKIQSIMCDAYLRNFPF